MLLPAVTAEAGNDDLPQSLAGPRADAYSEAECELCCGRSSRRGTEPGSTSRGWSSEDPRQPGFNDWSAKGLSIYFGFCLNLYLFSGSPDPNSRYLSLISGLPDPKIRDT